MKREPTFQDLFREAPNNKELAVLMSFVQVEWGLDELRAHWEGYLEASRAYGITWPSLVECTQEFGILLSDVASYEPISR